MNFDAGQRNQAVQSVSIKVQGDQSAFSAWKRLSKKEYLDALKELQEFKEFLSIAHHEPTSFTIQNPIKPPGSEPSAKEIIRLNKFLAHSCDELSADKIVRQRLKIQRKECLAFVSHALSEIISELELQTGKNFMKQLLQLTHSDHQSFNKRIRKNNGISNTNKLQE